MMGCASSTDSNMVSASAEDGLARLRNGTLPANIIADFVRLDERISKVEATCPAPRIATAEAWVEHLQSKYNILAGIENLSASKDTKYETNYNAQLMSYNENDGYDSEPNNSRAVVPTVSALVNGGLPNGVLMNRESATMSPTQDLLKLALNLNVINDVSKASTHEDFFASLSESALQMAAIKYYKEILEHTKTRLKTLMDSYTELNDLYISQDNILAMISGGTYMTRLEQTLDAQLETAREIRDKLGGTLEQWRISGLLLRACSKSATLALKQWHMLENIATSKEKLQNASQCRNTLQASLVSLEAAQQALPHVELKHISNRQTLAVKHCNTYMITDIADKARYDHTSKVFSAYESNMSQASAWLYETFDNTLRLDFDKAEETVRTLAKSLRDHREQVFTAAQQAQGE